MSGAPNGDSVQQPVFAPVSQNSKVSDDIDLGEIFSDYFISEANDPLNNFGGTSVPPPASVLDTTTMVTIDKVTKEHHQKTNQPSMMQNTQPKMTGAADAGSAPTTRVLMGGAIVLPTGHGIKTAWHAESLPNLAGSTIVMKQAQQPAKEPTVKKLKADEAVTKVPEIAGIPLAASHPNKEKIQGIEIQTQTPAHAGALAEESTTSNATSDKLDFAMTGSVPQNAMQQQQQPYLAQMAISESRATRVGSNIVLPVGVGIRVGVPEGVVAQGFDAGMVGVAHAGRGATPLVPSSHLFCWQYVRTGCC